MERRPMPLPNRVDPFGDLFATSARGLFLVIAAGVSIATTGRWA